MNESKRILLVEDEPMDARLMLIILREAGYEQDIQTVGDGVLALDYLHRRGKFVGRPTGHPALVLMDLKLPRVDGFEVLRQMRASRELLGVPVVVLSSSAHDSDVGRAYDLGANGYIVKRICFDEHAEAITTTARFWMEINHPLRGPLQQPFARAA